MPTCDCIVANAMLSGQTACQGDAMTALYAYDQLGDSPCCP
jgi:hypothetical protein